MHWTRLLVEYWITFYYELKDYAVGYRTAFYEDENRVRGKSNIQRAPYEMQAILNAEFDLGLRALKKYYGEDIRNVLGFDITEAREKKGFAIGILKKLMINSNRRDSKWMSKVI